MMMLATALYRAATQPAVIPALSWVAGLALRAFAGSLNIPETVLMNTCDFAVAYVEAVGRRATVLCPLRLRRQMRDRQLPTA